MRLSRIIGVPAAAALAVITAVVVTAQRPAAFAVFTAAQAQSGQAIYA
jgi:hypothetical protein